MVKNALQAQLLKAGLVDNKKAKKLSKQAQHEQRTGQSNKEEIKAQIAQNQQSKQEKDLTLNAKKQEEIEAKTLKSNVQQMIQQHKVKETNGDISYQFIDENKVKKIYIHQQAYNALVSGSLVVAKDASSYALLPKALAERIEQKLEGFILWNKSDENTQTTDEEDPYAAYVIPDDLMW
ncbi:hypothetical protein P256_00390 [Acinetobacter nectaris CIP 110549]|uniref:Nucleoprotein/polynucleotide-associated enzyme n=1 Tax=Acinetobacter nectaris CIP 110549 TaxID=1392540 RepID=V2TU09_9GAMM|nr:DUF2058 domain-containing protein [Acinetobacter nectaris]ESK40962.1 hypothetical protein P256_00390 [Acinetobacter nectaris CIP 110549]MCF9045991.1 DUF2058 domain-containing protein [Acinetobacter nectaris]